MDTAKTRMMALHSACSAPHGMSELQPAQVPRQVFARGLIVVTS